MAKDKRPVWLLDIDGVVNVPFKQAPSVWPDAAWRRTSIRNMPILVAQPVLDFITRMHESGKVEIRWHTTWRENAQDEFAPELGLPRFEVAKAAEFDDLSEPIRPQRGRWWKFNAAWRVVHQERRPLIWTDDDIRFMETRALQMARQTWPRSLLVAPNEWTALTPKHLAQIEAFVDANQPKPRQRRAQLAGVK